MSELMDDDEIQSEAEIELRANPANPALRRYDGRAVGQAERTLARKIRALDRTVAEIDACLKAHQDGTKLLGAVDLQVLRLRSEICEGQRNRLTGKPFIASNPNESKHKNPAVDARLQLAIQNLIMSPPPQLPPVEAAAQAEPEPVKAAMPESTLRLIEDMRERSRVARPF